MLKADGFGDDSVRLIKNIRKRNPSVRCSEAGAERGGCRRCLCFYSEAGRGQGGEQLGAGLARGGLGSLPGGGLWAPPTSLPSPVRDAAVPPCLSRVPGWIM